MNYLTMKNKFWLATARMLQKEGILNDSLFLLEGYWDEENYSQIDIAWRDYNSLLAIYFTDEEGYKRSLFVPLPVLEETRKGRAFLKKALPVKEGHIVSRAWHDYVPRKIPSGYYPDGENEEEGEEVILPSEKE